MLKSEKVKLEAKCLPACLPDTGRNVWCEFTENCFTVFDQ